MREQNHRHPQRALTARSVQAFIINPKSRRVADGGGLYLVAAPGGSKSWILRTVVKGKRSDIGLGSAAVVTLAEARENAHQLRKIARAGGDPLAERRLARKAVPTFEDAAKQVHAAHSRAFKNDKHRKQWLASLRPVFDVFGNKQVDAVTTADVLTALTSRWLSHPETSRRVLQRVKVVLEWCKAHGFCRGDNPTDGITKVLPKQRRSRAHHAALPYQEVPSFIGELRDARVSEPVRLALEFTILCAARTSETLNATWDEIDAETAVWTIPAARMKVGVEHRVPLSQRALDIVQRAKSISDGGPYVFAGRSGKQPLSTMAFLMALRRMNVHKLTTHGFRSSFRDWAAERTNFPHAVCEAALAHTLRNKTEAAYNRTDLFERRRELMATWSAFVASKPADVIAIRA